MKIRKILLATAICLLFFIPAAKALDVLYDNPTISVTSGYLFEGEKLHLINVFVYNFSKYVLAFYGNNPNTTVGQIYDPDFIFVQNSTNTSCVSVASGAQWVRYWCHYVFSPPVYFPIQNYSVGVLYNTTPELYTLISYAVAAYPNDWMITYDEGEGIRIWESFDSTMIISGLASPPSTYSTVLTGYCEIIYPDTNAGYMNTIQSCETSSLDTLDCMSIDIIRGYNFINTWDWNDSWAGSTDYNFTMQYAFNTTNITKTENKGGSDFDYGQYVTDPLHEDANISVYLNKSGLFSTGYYYYNNSNITLSYFKAALIITCQVNTSILNGSCNLLCKDGYLYQNGVYDSINFQCVNFTTVTKCLTFSCGNITSCSGILTTYTNATSEGIIPEGITNTFLLALMTLLFSSKGVILLTMTTMSAAFINFLDEEFTFYIFAAFIFFFGILNLIPLWIGIILPIFAVSLAILSPNKGVKK